MPKIKKTIYNILKVTKLLALFNALSVFRILEIEFGHFISSWVMKPVDKKKNEVPWFTYPAIEYLNQLDLSGKNVFEYGSGNSTVFWSKKAKRVYAVEHDKEWFNLVKKRVKNINYELHTEKSDYVLNIQKAKSFFDIIIIDGEYRYDCAIKAVHYLKRGGFIILDNSDWFPKICDFLRKSNLIEVKFSGFAPSNHYTSTTSFFLSRAFKFKVKSSRIPGHIGGVNPTAKP